MGDATRGVYSFRANFNVLYIKNRGLETGVSCKLCVDIPNEKIK